MSRQTDQKGLSKATVSGLCWAVWAWSFAEQRWDWLPLFSCRRLARERARLLRMLGTPARVRRVQVPPPERKVNR